MTAVASKVESVFWTIPREWDGGTCYIIGGGSSLKQFDFGLLKGRRVIGCNDAFRLGPEIISYALFGDSAFYCRNIKELGPSCPVRLVTCSPTIYNMNVAHIRKLHREMEGIFHGNSIGFNYSTGAAAINLAINLGATQIYLLGFDLANLGGKSHWHDHNQRLTQDFSFKRFQRGFAKVQASLPEGVSVLNVTDGSSRLESFSRITFEQFYQHLAQ